MKYHTMRTFPFSRDQFYSFGEIRSVTMVHKQQCAFIQFTNRSGAEEAAEKTFNKLILGGRRLNIKWGKSQASQTTTTKGEDDGKFEPVPGLPAGKCADYRID